MTPRFRAELAGAALAATAGAWFVAGSFRLGIGTALQMKAGFFPLMLGGMMIFLAVAVLVSAWSSQEPLERPDLRSAAFVTAGLIAFVMTLERVGLIAAVMLLVVLAMLALKGARWQRMAALAVGAALLCWVVFKLGIGVPVPAWRSPF